MSEAQSGEWTVRRILDWTTQHLRTHGSESPRLDAEILLAHARGCRRIDLYTRYDETLTDEQRTTMRDLVQRRAKHEPVAYLVGKREFYNLDFRVTADVLIPRPDTETLVMELLAAIEAVKEPRVLDLGTGSGCIAVSIAKNREDAIVTAIDLSEKALEVARGNAESNGVAGRMEFLRGDLFAPLSRGALFDAVASNPPYVRSDEMESLQPDARLHEPHGALDGGPEGLDVTKRVVAEAPEFLKPGGVIMIEIGHQQADAVRGLLESRGDFADVRIIRDLGRRNRVAAAIRK